MEPESSMTIDIVIPVYNEGENIICTLDALQDQVNSKIRVLICYDHDDDNTLEALNEKKYKFEVIPLKNQRKLVHGAVLTGFFYDESPAVISYMADDDYNASVIDQMIDSFYSGADVVVGSRFIRGGTMRGCRWQKAWLVRVVAFSLRYLARLPAHDPTNAFRLFSRKLLRRVKIESSQGFSYSIELLVKCHRLGWNIIEVPALWFEREKGTSRFQILKWADAYLHWYCYAFETTYFQKRDL